LIPSFKLILDNVRWLTTKICL